MGYALTPTSGSRVQPLQHPRKPAARSHPPPARHAAVETEASLKCRSCRKGRTAPPVHMIKLTDAPEITPYKWMHPEEER